MNTEKLQSKEILIEANTLSLAILTTPADLKSTDKKNENTNQEKIFSKIQKEISVMTLNSNFNYGISPPSLVNFYAIGDWGENGCGLIKNSYIMKYFANIKNPNFITALGDNFYECGVKSLNDPLWYEVFEQNFQDIPSSIPFYAILGNHDWQGNIDAQLQYNKFGWKMESPYYMKRFDTVEFYFIDTTSLCPKISGWLTGLKFSTIDVDKQMKWLRQNLSQSNAEWIFIFGHYPIYSAGENGSTDELQKLEKLMKKYNVDAYFCGHDHSLQHLYNIDTDIHYFVSGSGAGRMGYLRNIKQSVSSSRDAGFINCNVYDNHTNIQFINSDGRDIYSVDIPKKAKKLHLN